MVERVQRISMESRMSGRREKSLRDWVASALRALRGVPEPPEPVGEDCPHCGSGETIWVIQYEQGGTGWRTRRCSSCGRWFGESELA